MTFQNNQVPPASPLICDMDVMGHLQNAPAPVTPASCAGLQGGRDSVLRPVTPESQARVTMKMDRNPARSRVLSRVRWWIVSQDPHNPPVRCYYNYPHFTGK